MGSDLQHDNVIWGTRCGCGENCSILQSRHHPWSDTGFVARIECPGCGRTLRVDRAKADVFYGGKIHDRFRDASGVVLDLGCGGGFLSRFALGLPSVTEVFGIDNDEGCLPALEDLEGDGRFHFLNRDVSDLRTCFSSIAVDYVIGRDILMFVEDPDRLVADISAIARVGFRLMGWYIPDSPRVANTAHPADFARMFRSHGRPCRIEFLDWYRAGYFLTGDRWAGESEKRARSMSDVSHRGDGCSRRIAFPRKGATGTSASA